MTKNKCAAYIILASMCVLALLFCPKVPAESKTMDVCKNGICYEQTVPDFKSFQWLTAQDGTKFVRIYTYDGKLIDIYGRDLTVQIQKDKNLKRKKK